ncbi:hypothetical protein LCGC14_2679660, partial [marine sediment metagenome]
LRYISRYGRGDEHRLVVVEQLTNARCHFQTCLAVGRKFRADRLLLLQSFRQETTAVLSPGFVQHSVSLSGKAKSLAIQQRTAFDLLLVEAQLTAKAVQLQLLYGSNERPKLADMDRHAAAHLVWASVCGRAHSRP